MAEPEIVKSSVLVVDDEREHAQVMCEALSRQGHRCNVTYNFGQATEKLLKKRYDVVVTDLMKALGAQFVDHAAPDQKPAEHEKDDDGFMPVTREQEKELPRRICVRIVRKHQPPKMEADHLESGHSPNAVENDGKVLRNLHISAVRATAMG